MIRFDVRDEFAPLRHVVMGTGRGYHRLYLEQVNQAPEGCDFDFLRAAPGQKMR